MSTLETLRTKIVWAIDPFTTEKPILQSAVMNLKALVKSSESEVFPIFVWTQAPSGSLSGTVSEMKNQLEERGQKLIESLFKKAKLTGVHALKVVSKPTLSIRDEAETMIAQAKSVDANLIVVASHGRKGIGRWLLGSFAETLALYSDIPLLILRPGQMKIPDFKSILFPTDFSEASRQAFDHVVAFAAQRKGRITLFHKSSAVSYPVFDFGLPEYYADYQTALEDEQRAHEKTAAQWAAHAKARGVKTMVVFNRSRSESAAQAIVKQAKKEAGIIAMASHSGAFTSALLGSSTRQVLRHSTQPVWVLHPRKISR